MKLPNKPYLPPVKDISDINKTLFSIWEQIARVLNGHIWFGSVADGIQNMDGVTLQHTSGAADTAFSLTHNLGRIPVGYLVVYVNKAAIIYDGGVTWTRTTISLKSNAATTILRVFVF